MSSDRIKEDGITFFRRGGHMKDLTIVNKFEDINNITNVFYNMQSKIETLKEEQQAKSRKLKKLRFFPLQAALIGIVVCFTPQMLFIIGFLTDTWYKKYHLSKMISMFVQKFNLSLLKGNRAISEQIFLHQVMMILFIVSIAVLAGIGGHFYKQKKKKEYRRRIIEIEDDIEEKESYIHDYIVQNRELLKEIPRDYFYPVATNFIAEAIRNGRADTLKEALNLFHQQLHFWKIEKAYQQQYNLMLQQKKELESIKKEIIWQTVCMTLN
jgi:hypothetical protein